MQNFLTYLFEAIFAYHAIALVIAFGYHVYTRHNQPMVDAGKNFDAKVTTAIIQGEMNSPNLAVTTVMASEPEPEEAPVIATKAKSSVVPVQEDTGLEVSSSLRDVRVATQPVVRPNLSTVKSMRDWIKEDAERRACVEKFLSKNIHKALKAELTAAITAIS